MDQPGARDGSSKWFWLVLTALISVLAVTPVSAGKPQSPNGAKVVTAGPHSMDGAAAPGMIRGPQPSADVRQLVQWVLASGDNLELPFIVIDKRHAEVLTFGAKGVFRGRAPVLTGLARGDISPPGIGQRRLADIAPGDRITPAGRFIAALGRDLGTDDVLWVDYDAGISLHRVVAGKPSERRLQRLASATSSDNRISYGCINVPVKFFESVVRPLFKGTNGLVYILPESSPLGGTFPLASTAVVDRARSLR